MKLDIENKINLIKCKKAKELIMLNNINIKYSEKDNNIIDLIIEAENEARIRSAKTYCSMCQCYGEEGDGHKDKCKYGTKNHTFCSYINDIWFPNYDIMLEYNPFDHSDIEIL